MSLTQAGDSVMIADAGWRNQVIVPVSGPSASWGVSTIGRFSCHVPARAAHALGLGDLEGKWLRWDHKTMGVWGGQIRRVPSEIQAGTLELSADTFHVRMKGIRTPLSLRTATGTPGQLALYLITVSATDKRLWFDSIDGSAGGRVRQLDLRGDDLFDVIDALAADNDHEYNIVVNDDGTIDWEFRYRVGENKTGSVVLMEKWNVIGGGISPTIDQIANDILAVPDDQDWVGSPKRAVIDPDSIQLYGRQAVTRRYSGTPGAAGIATLAKLDLLRDAKLAVPATVTLRENDPALRSIRDGDTVRFWSASQNKRYFLRVISRSVQEGIAKLAGDCIDEDDRD